MDEFKETKQEYKKMVEKATPNSKIFKDCIKAFLSGGAICVCGELIFRWGGKIGLAEDDARIFCSIILILASAILTGFGLYSKMGKHCGAGTIVPITGFANSVVSPAIEFKKEGFILGLGAKIFTVAGPVILYGVLTSMAIGLIYFIIGGVA